MSKISAKIDVNTNLTLLSSKSIIKKTENFLSQTKSILDVDFFISKIAESITKNFDRIFLATNKANFQNPNISFKVETSDKAFAFMIKFGFQLGMENELDIVFYEFLNNNSNVRQNDTSIKSYLQSHPTFSVWVVETSDISKKSNFQKVYRLSNTAEVNFPLLTQEQLKLVTTENENVVIQGVAGSGKTNVCIEKIVWCASKNYGGKILYTTFSRGLLNDTKIKIETFKERLKKFADELSKNSVVFLDDDHKRAIENYLGIFFFADETNIPIKIQKMIDFFENKVDYFLIQDLYRTYFPEKDFADEEYFTKKYLTNIKNHQIASKISKLKNLSTEIIYKEIYGLIFGFCKENHKEILSQEEYVELRKNSFQKFECEIIFQIAIDYQKHLISNGLTDNNFASREMLENITRIPRYSLVVADEVQDFTQINLNMLKAITLKMFCTGDALQMINPSYFSFGYLKNLLFEKDIISVAELKNNYRNTIKIQEIIDGLEEINVQKFGTHNFITTGVGVDNSQTARAVYCADANFLKEIEKNKYDSFTIVVSSVAQKKLLRETIKNQEILTIAEIKGLERDTVLLYNILSDSSDKWAMLDRIMLNKKQADENSVFRYYFNMFYVGVSRAKQNLFVCEAKNINSFSKFFQTHFDCQNQKTAINSLSKIVAKIEYTQDEYLKRVAEFLKLEQFENARFAADKITDDIKRKNEFIKIDIYQNYVHQGKYREAGIKFWEEGLIDEAKKQFMLSGDTTLINLIDAVSENNESSLNYDIIKYFFDVRDNDVATQFILETIKRDLRTMQASNKDLHEKLKKIRGQKNGK